MNSPQKVFICDCNTPEHQFVIEYFDGEPEVYINIRLNTYGNVFQRGWRALRYVLRAREAEYDCVILDDNKQRELIRYLQGKGRRERANDNAR